MSGKPGELQFEIGASSDVAGLVSGEASAGLEAAVQRLLVRCAVADGDPGWLAYLRDHQAELASATRGRSWTIDLHLYGQYHRRLGITADGHVVCPLGPGGEDDAQIAGEPEDVARFFLGEGSLDQALLKGLVLLPWPATASTLGDLGRLREVVVSRLRQFTLMSAGWVLGARRRSRWMWAAESEGLVQRVAPAVAVAVFTVGVAAVPLSLDERGDARTPLSRMASVATTTHATSGADPTPPSKTVVRDASNRTRAEIRGSVDGRNPAVLSEGSAPEPMFRATVDAPEPPPTPAPPRQVWFGFEVPCDSAVRALLCAVLPDAPSPPTPGP